MSDSIYIIIYSYAILFFTFRTDLSLGLTLPTGWALPIIAMLAVDNPQNRNVELNMLALYGTCVAYLAWLWSRKKKGSGGSRNIGEDPYGDGGGGE